MSKHEVCSRVPPSPPLSLRPPGLVSASPSVHRAGSVFLLSAPKGHTAAVDSLLIRGTGGRGTAAVPPGASVRSSSAPTHKRCVCVLRSSSGCAGGPGPHGEQAANLFPAALSCGGAGGWRGGQTELSMTHGLVPRLPENKHNGPRHTMAPLPLLLECQTRSQPFPMLRFVLLGRRARSLHPGRAVWWGGGC